MIGPLLAYDATGNIVATLDSMVARDADGNVTGLIDFAAHEAADGEHTDIWSVSDATGAKTWPEWLGGRAHDFRVELAGPPGHKHIAALIHRAAEYVSTPGNEVSAPLFAIGATLGYLAGKKDRARKHISKATRVEATDPKLVKLVLPQEYEKKK